MKMAMSSCITATALLLLTLKCVLAADGSGDYGAYGTNFFAESSSTYYSGYEQAWRYLGWYVKCGDPSDRYDEGDSHEDSHENSHSGDNNNKWTGNNWCQRYLIWAAYVDENYQGGGVGEYAHFDPYENQWDTSACDVHGNGRCAPMDCHMNNSTTWTLMGVFKEASYFGNDAFFEQLFKHEGVCVWNDDELYEFMSDARENSWPQGCVSTGIQISNAYYSESSSSGYNDYIYIDLKPTYNGNMTYGLYTDSTCKYEYELTDTNVETIAKSMGLLYGDYLEMWNDGLEIYKVCQPCKSYNLKNDYYQGNYYGEYADDEDPNEGYFECYDDAGYTNVNQCMKFRTHAELEVATWEDLVTATNQGGILQVNISGTVFGSERMSAEDYKYLQKMRLAEVKKSAQVQAQARWETAKVEAMRPSARSWQGLGGLFLFSGIVAMVGSLLLLRSHHINRTNQLLTQPLIVSKRGGSSGGRFSSRGLVVPKQGGRSGTSLSALVFPQKSRETANENPSEPASTSRSKQKPSGSSATKTTTTKTTTPSQPKDGGIAEKATSTAGLKKGSPTHKTTASTSSKQKSSVNKESGSSSSADHKEGFTDGAAVAPAPVDEETTDRKTQTTPPVNPKQVSGRPPRASVPVAATSAQVIASLPPVLPKANDGLDGVPKTRKLSEDRISESSKSSEKSSDSMSNDSADSRVKGLGLSFRFLKGKKKAPKLNLAEPEELNPKPQSKAKKTSLPMKDESKLDTDTKKSPAPSKVDSKIKVEQPLPQSKPRAETKKSPAPSKVDPTTRPEVKKDEQPGSSQASPDTSPFFLSQSLLNNEDLFVDPDTTTQETRPTGAIEMNEHGMPFFLTHSYMNKKTDVMSQVRSDVVDTSSRNEQVPKSGSDIAGEIDEAVLLSRSSDD